MLLKKLRQIWWLGVVSPTITLANVRCHYCTQRATHRDYVVRPWLGSMRHATWNRLPTCKRCLDRDINQFQRCDCDGCKYARNRYFVTKRDALHYPSVRNTDLDEVDRNARAFGWEIGNGNKIEEVVESSDNNPFLDRDWRNRDNWR